MLDNMPKKSMQNLKIGIWSQGKHGEKEGTNIF